MLTEAVILRLQFLGTETTPGWRTCCPTLHTASRWSPSTLRALGRSSAGMVAQVRVRYTPSPFQGNTHLQGCENKHHKSTRTQGFFLRNIRENGAEKQAINTRQMATNVYWSSTREIKGCCSCKFKWSRTLNKTKDVFPFRRGVIFVNRVSEQIKPLLLVLPVAAQASSCCSCSGLIVAWFLDLSLMC